MSQANTLIEEYNRSNPTDRQPITVEILFYLKSILDRKEIYTKPFDPSMHNDLYETKKFITTHSSNSVRDHVSKITLSKNKGGGKVSFNDKKIIDKVIELIAKELDHTCYDYPLSKRKDGKPKNYLLESLYVPTKRGQRVSAVSLINVLKDLGLSENFISHSLGYKDLDSFSRAIRPSRTKPPIIS